MANNQHFYGFRWAQNWNGKPQPQPIEMAVASGGNFTVSGDATNLNLNAGDPVKINTDGTVILSGGNENSQTPGITWGIMVGMGGQGYYNGTRMVRAAVLPSGATYGTNVDRQSKVLVVPCSAGVWEIDVDDNTTATTYLGYQAFIGENAEHQCYPNSQGHVDADLMVNPLLNIASHATTSTLAWRIVGISQSLSNQDYSGKYVKLLVSVNKGAEPFYTATGT
jgi:hypothetical protein